MNDAPITEYPLNGKLDLHMFRPGEVKSLVPEYLEVCRERGILEIRIIHGKGTGSLRRTVHSVLNRLDCVSRYYPASGDRGGWGATIVCLHPGLPDVNAGDCEE